MLKYLSLMLLLFCSILRAEEAPEDTFNRLTQAMNSIAPGADVKATGTCLPVDKLYTAASANLPQLETMIFNAMQHPARTKEFIGPYFRLWVLGKLGQDFFDLMVPNPGIEETYEIENGMYLTGVYTKTENGRTYWVPILIDTRSQNLTILKWEQCRGKCYSNESVTSSKHGICGKWSWNKKTKQITSFCSCNDRNDCGAKNIYIIQVANLVLLESLRKRKCDGKPFDESAKPCCMR